MRQYHSVCISIPNLNLLLQTAARACQSASIENLINSPLKMTYLLTRLSSRTLFVAAMPATANLSLGHLGDPLAQTLYKQQVNHVSHLRDHGAAPNSRCASYKGPGCHLRVTAQKFLLEYTKLLLQRCADLTIRRHAHDCRKGARRRVG